MLRLNAVHLAVCLLPLALAGCGEPADHDDPRIRPPLVRVAVSYTHLTLPTKLEV